METYQLVIIGSGPGGIGAANAYIEAGGEKPVLLLTAEHVPPYDRPPLSKEKLRAQAEPEPELLGEPKDVELRLGATVTALDIDSRIVSIGDEQIGFEKLVLAPGSKSRLLPDLEDGADVRYLRSFADLQTLHTAASHARSAVVIGSGFIGCEAAISLAMKGIAVTMVSPEDAPQASRLGEHAAGVIAGILRGHDVDVRAGTVITSLHAPRTVHLSDGTTLEPDLILAAVGAEPATDFVDPAALQMHEGRIVVDRHMRTNVDGVYAVGDAARAEHALAGRALTVEHWDDADAMGKVAGVDAAGGDAEWESIPGFWTDLGEHTMMYSAWGDGFDDVQVVERSGGFTAWYGADGALVGVLTYNADDDYDRGRELIAQGSTVEAAAAGAQPDSPPDDDEPGAE